MNNEKKSKCRLISFDVGIKNMAYCIFDILSSSPSSLSSLPPSIIINETDNINILDWSVLNLMNTEAPVKKECLCNYVLENKKKKSTIQLLCNKKAKYNKNQHFLCEKHAVQSNYILPLKEYSIPLLKKKKKRMN